MKEVSRLEAAHLEASRGKGFESNVTPTRFLLINWKNLWNEAERWLVVFVSDYCLIGIHVIQLLLFSFIPSCVFWVHSRKEQTNQLVERRFRLSKMNLAKHSDHCFSFLHFLHRHKPRRWHNFALHRNQIPICARDIKSAMKYSRRLLSDFFPSSFAVAQLFAEFLESSSKLILHNLQSEIASINLATFNLRRVSSCAGWRVEEKSSQLGRDLASFYMARSSHRHQLRKKRVHHRQKKGTRRCTKAHWLQPRLSFIVSFFSLLCVPEKKPFTLQFVLLPFQFVFAVDVKEKWKREITASGSFDFASIHPNVYKHHHSLNAIRKSHNFTFWRMLSFGSFFSSRVAIMRSLWEK